MPEEDLEVVRRFVDAHVRGDRDAFIALLDPEFEGVPPSEWPESATARGREAAWDFELELELTLGGWRLGDHRADRGREWQDRDGGDARRAGQGERR